VPIVFSARPGQVVRLDEPGVACTTDFLSLDPDVGVESERSIVTRLTVDHAVNAQFLHTLGSLVYVYVFGDRMGTVTLSGLAFPCACPQDGDGQDGGPGGSGAERMLLWYKRHRASRRSEPVRVTLGRTVLEGFVTGFNEDVVEPSLRLVQWGLTLAALPEDD